MLRDVVKRFPDTKIAITDLSRVYAAAEVAEEEATEVRYRRGVNEQFDSKASIQINSIRSIYPKDNVRDIVNWISRGDLLRYADKKKIEDWITQQRSNSADVEIQNLDVAANIVKEFENPAIDGENVRCRQTEKVQDFLLILLIIREIVVMCSVVPCRMQTRTDYTYMRCL